MSSLEKPSSRRISTTGWKYIVNIKQFASNPSGYHLLAVKNITVQNAQS